MCAYHDTTGRNAEAFLRIDAADVIYDAVGNVVASGLRLDQANPQQPRDYAVFWDGRNRNGLFVGGGTYLMIVKACDIDDKGISRRVKIGVRIKG